MSISGKYPLVVGVGAFWARLSPLFLGSQSHCWPQTPHIAWSRTPKNFDYSPVQRCEVSFQSILMECQFILPSTQSNFQFHLATLLRTDRLLPGNHQCRGAHVHSTLWLHIYLQTSASTCLCQPKKTKILERSCSFRDSARNIFLRPCRHRELL